MAGLLSGVVGACYQAVITEPVLERAIALESQAAGHDHGEPLVSRAVQQVGGAVTMVVIGALLGVAFAGLMHLARPRLPDEPLTAALTLSGLVFLALGVFPALKTPAAPPGVGDPADVGERTLVYLMVLVLGVIWMVAALLLPATMRAHARTRSHAGAGTVILATATAGVLLALTPGLADAVPVGYPADLVWDFRVASLGQTLVMALALPIAFTLVVDAPGRTRRGRRPTSVRS